MVTVFEKIISKEIPSDTVYEDEKIIAIKDINPQAPVHLLIIPKKPIAKIHEMDSSDLPIMGEMIKVAQKLAKEFHIEDGYRLVINNGEKAAQTIFHLHMHLLGGKKLSGIMV